MGRTPSLSVPPWPWLLPRGKRLPRQGTTASFFLTPLPSPTSPGKGFPQPGGGSGCSWFWERVPGVHGVGMAHGCSPESDGSSSSEPPPLPLSAPTRIRGGKILPNLISHFDPRFLYTETFKTCPLRATTTKKINAPSKPNPGRGCGWGMRRYRVPPRGCGSAASWATLHTHCTLTCPRQGWQ